MLRAFRAVTAAAVASVVVVAVAPAPAAAARRGVSSLSSSPVTIYGAKWCSACRSLERSLAERKVPFELVDVDDNPAAFARARAASGASTAIPLTSVVRSTNVVWITGADPDAVERALRGD